MERKLTVVPTTDTPRGGTLAEHLAAVDDLQARISATIARREDLAAEVEKQAAAVDAAALEIDYEKVRQLDQERQENADQLGRLDLIIARLTSEADRHHAAVQRLRDEAALTTIGARLGALLAEARAEPLDLEAGVLHAARALVAALTELADRHAAVLATQQQAERLAAEEAAIAQRLGMTPPQRDTAVMNTIHWPAGPGGSPRSAYQPAARVGAGQIAEAAEALGAWIGSIRVRGSLDEHLAAEPTRRVLAAERARQEAVDMAAFQARHVAQLRGVRPQEVS